MANRRMFSNKIIDSARFVKMPVSSQNLYFHLGMKADDDGIVEAYNVMCVTGATEDDLKILVAKGYITVLNEDLVSFINDWAEHNKIRADRKIDSIYKDLLIKMVPDIDLIEKKPRADVKKNNHIVLDSQWTDDGQPMDGIGKVRLGKDRLGKEIVSKDTICSTDVQLVMSEWNKIGVNPIKGITTGTNRHKLLTARMKQHGTDTVVEAVKNIHNSPFLQGQNKQGWMITFDWFLKPNNFIKVMEGNYKDRDKEEPEHGNNIRILSANEIAERIQQGG